MIKPKSKPKEKPGITKNEIIRRLLEYHEEALTKIGWYGDNKYPDCPKCYPKEGRHAAVCPIGQAVKAAKVLGEAEVKP